MEVTNRRKVLRKPPPVSRRQFCEFAILFATAISTTACASAVAGSPPLETEGTDGFPVGLSSLGGAPNTPQGRTIAALCDTVIPSKTRDP